MMPGRERGSTERLRPGPRTKCIDHRGLMEECGQLRTVLVGPRSSISPRLSMPFVLGPRSSFCAPAFNTNRPPTREPRSHLVPKRPVQVVITQRPLARLANPAATSSEEHSALVALPRERRLAEKRRHLHDRERLRAAPRGAGL